MCSGVAFRPSRPSPSAGTSSRAPASSSFRLITTLYGNRQDYTAKNSERLSTIVHAFSRDLRAYRRGATLALADALQAAEHSAKAPPIEWVSKRLEQLQEVLERETVRSALLLRRILGPFRLKPIRPQVGRPSFEAETALQVLELIQDPEGGSTLSKWWTQSQPIRIVAELPLSFPLLETRLPFAYQYIAERASELWRLGMSACLIARALVSGCREARQRRPPPP